MKSLHRAPASNSEYLFIYCFFLKWLIADIHLFLWVFTTTWRLRLLCSVGSNQNRQSSFEQFTLLGPVWLEAAASPSCLHFVVWCVFTYFSLLTSQIFNNLTWSRNQSYWQWISGRVSKVILAKYQIFFCINTLRIKLISGALFLIPAFSSIQRDSREEETQEPISSSQRSRK